MQTFKYDLRFQATVIVPEKFLEQTLAAVNADDATPFLIRLRDEFSSAVADLTNDDKAAYAAACDTLVAAVLTNAIRKSTQANLSLTLAQAELGCRVAPVEVLSLETLAGRASVDPVAVAQAEAEAPKIPQAEVAAELDAALAEQAEHDRQSSLSPANAAPYGAAVQELQDSRDESWTGNAYGGPLGQ